MSVFGFVAILCLLLAIFCQGTPIESLPAQNLVAIGTQYCMEIPGVDLMYNQTSGPDVPPVEDCRALAASITNDFTLTLDYHPHNVAYQGKCFFAAMGAASVNGPNVSVTIGAADVADKINKSIAAFATAGRVGAIGRSHCRQTGAPDNSPAYMFEIAWVIQ